MINYNSVSDNVKKGQYFQGVVRFIAELKNIFFQKNYRGHRILIAGGPLLFLSVLPCWLFFVFSDYFHLPDLKRIIFLSTIVTAIGLVDDVAGESEVKGFRGHFGHLFQGQLTTGLLKVFLISAAVFFILINREYVQVLQPVLLLQDLLLFLLLINLFNLLDLRPGRTVKFFYFSLLLMVIFISGFRKFLPVILPLAVVLVPYLYFELTEKIMLGDSGAAFLGAVIGYGLLFWETTAGKTILLFLLLILNLLAEKYSFSEVIAGNRFLSWLDGSHKRKGK